MPEYRALDTYVGEEAATYDDHRFVSPKGRLVDRLEWGLVDSGLRRLLRFAPVRTVADVPAGTGRISLRLLGEGYAVTAVDASEDMLAVARRKAAAHEYVVGRVEELPLASGAVDAVVSVRLFGHLPDETKLDALREFARVADVGVVVLFVCDNALLTLRRRFQARSGRKLQDWHPVSPRKAEELLRLAGLRPVASSGLLGPFAETRAFVAVKEPRRR